MKVQEAFNYLDEHKVDLVLSDVVLAEDDGVSLCRKLHERPETAHIPVVLISGRRIEEGDQVEGLHAGADDYLLKPVSGKVLVAKIHSVLRRYKAPTDLAEALKAHDLSLDVRARVATVKGKRIALTRKEFDLLTLFLQKPGQMLTSAYLLERVWGLDPSADVDTRTLTVHISSLRGKLGGDLGRRIATLPREGYRFDN
jgi:two-component system, OmpR family, alkaline phosphatase synthesis response regulator PhoP